MANVPIGTSGCTKRVCLHRDGCTRIRSAYPECPDPNLPAQSGQDGSCRRYSLEIFPDSLATLLVNTSEYEFEGTNFLHKVTASRDQLSWSKCILSSWTWCIHASISSGISWCHRDIAAYPTGTCKQVLFHKRSMCVSTMLLTWPFLV